MEFIIFKSNKLTALAAVDSMRQVDCNYSMDKNCYHSVVHRDIGVVRVALVFVYSCQKVRRKIFLFYKVRGVLFKKKGGQ